MVEYNKVITPRFDPRSGRAISPHARPLTTATEVKQAMLRDWGSGTVISAA